MKPSSKPNSPPSTPPAGLKLLVENSPDSQSWSGKFFRSVDPDFPHSIITLGKILLNNYPFIIYQNHTYPGSTPAALEESFFLDLYHPIEEPACQPPKTGSLFSKISSQWRRLFSSGHPKPSGEAGPPLNS